MDSVNLPPPATDMYEFYEGLDSNFFSESTGINHNKAAKWLKAEMLQNRDYLSYLLDIVNDAVKMSNNVVHTGAILNGNVTLAKLAEDIQILLQNPNVIKVPDRNSILTANCITFVAGTTTIRVNNNTRLTQANGFGAYGQIDLIETLAQTDIASTIGPNASGYIYKVYAGAFEQSTTPLPTLDKATMVGSRVLLGTFTTDASGFVISTTPVVPNRSEYSAYQTSETGVLYLPSGPTAQRPVLPANIRAIRFNTDLVSFEGWNGTAWGSLGGGATGGSKDKVFIENEYTITSDYTIPAGKSAVTVADSNGNVTINSGVNVTVSAGSRWVIL